MQAKSPNPSPSSDTSTDRLAAALYQVIEASMIEEFKERYDAGLQVLFEELEHLDGARDKSRLRLRICCRGLTEMPAQLMVTEAGHNAYDVLCTVQDGSSHRFSYCLPSNATSALSCAPYLGRDLATFLRTELENRLGRLLLQGPARPPTE